MRRVLGGVLVGAIMAPVALAAPESLPATTAPATAPATVAAEEAGPNATVAAFFTAVRAGDAKGMMACLDVTATNRPAVEALVNLSAASARLQAEMEKHFGAEELARAKISPLVAPASAIAEARRAKPAITGDVATVSLGSAPRVPATITLRQVDGRWLIDTARTMGIGDPTKAEQAEKLESVMKACAQAMDKTREEIEAGKWGSAGAAHQSLQEKLLLAGKPLAETTSRPATSTAPAK